MLSLPVPDTHSWLPQALDAGSSAAIPEGTRQELERIEDAGGLRFLQDLVAQVKVRPVLAPLLRCSNPRTMACLASIDQHGEHAQARLTSAAATALFFKHYRQCSTRTLHLHEPEMLKRLSSCGGWRWRIWTGWITLNRHLQHPAVVCRL